LRLWTFALRSAVVQRGRSVFLILSMAVGSGLLVLGGALVFSVETNMARGLREAVTGDLEVVDPGNPLLELTDERPLDYRLLKEPGRYLKRIEEDPDVRAVAPRLQAGGMLELEERSAPVAVVGIDPRREAAVSPGLRPADGSALTLERGEILLGPGIAKRLGVQRGDRVTVLLPTPDGLFDGDSFEVVGAYRPPGVPVVGEFFSYVRLDDRQELLGVGDAVGSLVVRLKPGRQAGAVRERWRRSPPGGLRMAVQTWEELGRTLLGVNQVGALGLGMGFALLLLIIVFGLAHTTLIMVFERTREFGTMIAMGARRGQVLRLVLLEVGVLAAVAAGVGALGGGALAAIVGHRGIPAVSAAMAYAMGGERFHIVVEPHHLLMGFLSVVAAALLAGLYPAWRAATVDPAKALRTP